MGYIPPTPPPETPKVLHVREVGLKSKYVSLNEHTSTSVDQPIMALSDTSRSKPRRSNNH